MGSRINITGFMASVIFEYTEAGLINVHSIAKQ